MSVHVLFDTERAGPARLSNAQGKSLAHQIQCVGVEVSRFEGLRERTARHLPLQWNHPRSSQRVPVGSKLQFSLSVQSDALAFTSILNDNERRRIDEGQKNAANRTGCAARGAVDSPTRVRKRPGSMRSVLRWIALSQCIQSAPWPSSDGVARELQYVSRLSGRT